ncbi:trehalose-phosphatase [Aquabacter cavernae]|uniref:trehalose-phosphatase n=1 Tax=Aquabacter cavernae TaxID=2496029 RepID=UPI0013DECA55|nr:trehalose-phosphatase [Aquabacter cavernae]
MRSVDLRDLLSVDQNAFFFDVDGTLIDIAPHPDAVEVPPTLIDHLSVLMQATGGALALVSGREASVLDRLFAPLKLPLSGIHGAQFRPTGEGESRLVAALLPDDVRTALRDLSVRFEGVLVEDKGASVALHYRAAPAVAPELEEAVARIVAPRARTLAVLPGRMVFEVKTRGQDKGAAVRAFLAEPPFAGRVPVFFGDDVTDEAGFAAVREHGGLAVSVGRRLAGADLTIETAQAVRMLIRRLAAAAEGRS